MVDLEHRLHRNGRLHPAALVKVIALLCYYGIVVS
jgi:hypothetical protein